MCVMAPQITSINFLFNGLCGSTSTKLPKLRIVGLFYDSPPLTAPSRRASNGDVFFFMPDVSWTCASIYIMRQEREGPRHELFHRKYQGWHILYYQMQLKLRLNALNGRSVSSGFKVTFFRIFCSIWRNDKAKFEITMAATNVIAHLIFYLYYSWSLDYVFKSGFRTPANCTLWFSLPL